MKKLCIYHGNCTDGFGAAWAVKQALGDDVEFFKGVYGDLPPDVTGRDVIMVDFSYKMDVIDIMLDFAKSITIIDHHKTAEAEVMPALQEQLVDGIFDMNKSGAVLAWEWFHPHTDVPLLLQHIQDRDLWKFELEGTRDIIAALSSYDFDFDEWSALVNGDIQSLRQEGAAINRAHLKSVNSHIKSSASRIVIDEFNVPAINAPGVWASDSGNILCEGEPFAVCYWHKSGAMVFSLRSSDKGMDVSEVAKRFGGGGHRNAAGFSIEMGDFDTLNIQSNFKERNPDQPH